jgi:Bacterial Ig-like domain
MNLSIATKFGFSAVALAAVLVACPQPEPTIDTVKPTVTTPNVISPAIGKLATVKIVFSEAMSKDVTLAAVTVSPSAGTKAFNAANTELTLTPPAAGWTEGATYTVTITTKAADAATTPNTLAVEKKITFSVASGAGAQTITLTSDAARDGTVGSTGGIFLATDDLDATAAVVLRASIRVGNSTTDSLRGFYTFKLDGAGGLPATLDPAKIVSAKLVVRQKEYAIDGAAGTALNNPFGATNLATATDGLTVDDVSFGPALNAAAYGVTGTKIGNIATAFDTAVDGELVVTDAVKADWTAKSTNGALSQYRLAFPKPFVAGTAAVTNKSIRLFAGNAATNGSKLVITYNP